MSNADSEVCFHCGWLGWCVAACPLGDPASSISPRISTSPRLDEELDEENFEIVLGEDKPAPPQSSPE